MPLLSCPGFAAAGLAAGIKKNGRKDLGLIFCERSAAVAGLFTRNRVQAAPVRLDRERVKRGRCRAVIVNSGNANCCTGEEGELRARRMARAAALALGVAEEEVLVASTGVIGEPLPIALIEQAAPALAAALRPEGIADFAEAIMTTDRVPKAISVERETGAGRFRLTGVVKGAGMIRPDLATLLSFLMTDLEADAEALRPLLAEGAERSFNRITVDGDTSTNDTVLLLASGASGVGLGAPGVREAFREALGDVMERLARWVVRDAEGSTKVVDIVVRGAASDADARRIAETVAHSPLVKTALFGEDANWGRILAAAGRSGAEIDPAAVNLYVGPVQIVAGGVGCGKEAEAAATEVLRAEAFPIVIEAGRGPGTASLVTCDFSIDYVKINADYRS